LFDQLVRLACERRPDFIICVDFSGFNRRLAAAIREKCRAQSGGDWHPKIIQYVSPQVWASRPGRAKQMARDYDLLLAIFPFEQGWYAEHAPTLRVEFVGHPIMERYPTPRSRLLAPGSAPSVLLLPGSRVGELKRHLPVMLEAARLMQAAVPAVSFRMVLPNEELRPLVTIPDALALGLQVQIGGLAEALASAEVAIASTGTVTLECAYFGVPTVAIYKTSWLTYEIGKRIIQVKHLAMPNLLADEVIFPELIQAAATGERISRATLELLNNPARRDVVNAKLVKVIEALGGAGASVRAARAILRLRS
jgi:lipid-A-disaccharide synthase